MCCSWLMEEALDVHVTEFLFGEECLGPRVCLSPAVPRREEELQCLAWASGGSRLLPSEWLVLR